METDPETDARAKVDKAAKKNAPKKKAPKKAGRKRKKTKTKKDSKAKKMKKEKKQKRKKCQMDDSKEHVAAKESVAEIDLLPSNETDMPPAKRKKPAESASHGEQALTNQDEDAPNEAAAAEDASDPDGGEDGADNGHRPEAGGDQDGDGSAEHFDNPERTVFVSRLPRYVTDETLSGVLSVFGAVESASVNMKKDDDSEQLVSQCFGFVVFTEEAARDKAVEKGVAKVKRKFGVGRQKIKIRAYDDKSEQRLGRGRDVGVCYQWQRFNCARGDACRFLHKGKGGCCPAPGTGKRSKVRVCWAFIKGSCKHGASCVFNHDQEARERARAKKAKTRQKAKGVDESQKLCFNFLKKGKCRKGDRCKYLHRSVGKAKS